MTTNRAVPADAEKIDIDPHMVRHRMPSKHVPGAQAVTYGLSCPGCKADLGRLIYCETVSCACGLSMVPQSALLLVWRRQPEPVV